MVKNSLKNIRGWKRPKNKNIQAGPKKWSAYKKNKCSLFLTKERKKSPSRGYFPRSLLVGAFGDRQDFVADFWHYGVFRFRTLRPRLRHHCQNIYDIFNENHIQSDRLEPFASLNTILNGRKL